MLKSHVEILSSNLTRVLYIYIYLIKRDLIAYIKYLKFIKLFNY